MMTEELRHYFIAPIALEADDVITLRFYLCGGFDPTPESIERDGKIIWHRGLSDVVQPSS